MQRTQIDPTKTEVASHPVPNPHPSTETPPNDAILFRQILDNLQIAIFWKDRDSVYLGCNQRFAADAGLDSTNEIRGKTDEEMTWTKDQAISFRRIDRQVMETGEPYHDTKEVRTISGEPFWVETNKLPLYADDGTVIGLLGVYRNINHRREAQEALHTSQEMLQLVMDNIPQYIFWKDRHSTYLGSNRNFAIAAGVNQPQNLIGKTDLDLPWLNDEAILCRSVDERVMEMDSPELHKTETLLMADGKHARVDVNKIPLHDGNGNVVGVLGTYEDITERIETQEALKLAHDELELRVKERTAELSQANTLLKQEIHERKQIEATEREQRTLAEALRDTAALLNSTLDLNEVLDRILSAIERVVPNHAANIVLVEEKLARIVRHRNTDNPALQNNLTDEHFEVESAPALLKMTQSQRALIVNDVSSNQTLSQQIAPIWVRSYLGAPIHASGNVIGFINLHSRKPQFFNHQHGEQLQAFADQAAIAIQNARLYTRAQDLATLEERQRLARDLHDAVSQTLWTANLMSEVLPTVWEKDPAEGKGVLKKFQRLNRGALAEMRSLLLELRPASLVETKLADLMEQLAEAFMSRKKIDVRFVMSGNATKLPDDVHIVLYRIAQESLNNVAKHSQATEVQIKLDYAPDQICLAIRDNGCGFQSEEISTERLGMTIMQERASSIAAQLVVTSCKEQGTAVEMSWRQKG